MNTMKGIQHKFKLKYDKIAEPENYLNRIIEDYDSEWTRILVHVTREVLQGCCFKR